MELPVAITIVIDPAAVGFFSMKSWRTSADMTVGMSRIRTLGLTDVKDSIRFKWKIEQVEVTTSFPFSVFFF